MKNMTIQQKIMFTNILFLICPILIMFIIAFFLVLQKSNFNVNHTKLSALQQKSEQILTMNDEIVEITNAILLDPLVNRVLSKKEYNSYYEYLEAKDIVREKVISTTEVFDSNRFGVTILGFNDYNFYPDSLDDISLEDFKNESWYEEFLQSNGTVFYLPQYKSEILTRKFEQGSLFVFRMIPNLNSGRNVAVIMIELTSDILLKEILQTNKDTSNYLITDNKGKVICSSIPDIYGTELTRSSYYPKISDYEKGFFLGNVNQIYSQILFVTLDTMNFKVLSYHTYVPEWDEFIFIILFIALICVILTFFMSEYNAIFISKKIKKINFKVLKITEGNLHTRIEGSYELEFRDLCKNFNKMLDYIEELINQLELEEQKKNYLEMQALQAQINPHFLHNTVAAIRFMLQMGEYEQADQAMLAFAKLLRKSFTDQRKIVAIKEELDLVDQYLIVMSVRYQDSFEWDIDIPTEIQNYGILRQVVQPLVENSISHGFNTKQQKGHIKISGVEKENEVWLTVEDDGLEADMQKIQSILSCNDDMIENQGHLSGIGLSNVQLRLKKTFGPQFGLEANFNKMMGVTFTVRIPKLATGSMQDEDFNCG